MGPCDLIQQAATHARGRVMCGRNDNVSGKLGTDITCPHLVARCSLQLFYMSPQLTCVPGVCKFRMGSFAASTDWVATAIGACPLLNHV